MSGISSTGPQFSGSFTLVAVNGLGVLVPVGIPLVISVLVRCALHRKCSRGGPFAGYLAWMLVVVLALGCVVAGASIGLLIVPVAVLWGAQPQSHPRALRQPKRHRQPPSAALPRAAFKLLSVPPDNFPAD